MTFLKKTDRTGLLTTTGGFATFEFLTSSILGCDAVSFGECYPAFRQIFKGKTVPKSVFMLAVPL